MNRLYFTILCVIVVTIGTCYSNVDEQFFDEGYPEELLNELEKYIPNGYRIVSVATGDLNRDGMTDYSAHVISNDASLTVAAIFENDNSSYDSYGSARLDLTKSGLVVIISRPSNEKEIISNLSWPISNFTHRISGDSLIAYDDVSDHHESEREGIVGVSYKLSGKDLILSTAYFIEGRESYNGEYRSGAYWRHAFVKILDRYDQEKPTRYVYLLKGPSLLDDSIQFVLCASEHIPAPSQQYKLTTADHLYESLLPLLEATCSGEIARMLKLERGEWDEPDARSDSVTRYMELSDKLKAQYSYVSDRQRKVENSDERVFEIDPSYGFDRILSNDVKRLYFNTNQIKTMIINNTIGVTPNYGWETNTTKFIPIPSVVKLDTFLERVTESE